MSIQDQYTNALRQSQEAWAGILDTITSNVQAATKAAIPTGSTDPSAAIDQIFDFWSKTLEAQRDAIKQLATASIAAGEKVRSQAEQAGATILDHTEATLQSARAQSKPAAKGTTAAK